jgi:hypothetical protein
MTRVLWFSMLALPLALGCDDGGNASTPSDAAPALAQPDARVGDAGADAQAACKIPVDCPDVVTSFFTTKACCTTAYACGYELPAVDDITRSLFPMLDEFAAKYTYGDPAGRCADSELYFGVRPGLDEQRVEPDEGDDILITPSCMSYTLAAFILPGCCLPDNSCALSTHESYFTLEYINDNMPAPFTRPECVPAEVLNQQLRESARLSAYARTKASGSCDYAALSAKLPPSQ